MTKITTMGDRVEQVNRFLDEMVRCTWEKEDVAKDFSDVLHLIIPGDGHRLLTLGNWRHSHDLEYEIIGWLAEVMDSQEEFRSSYIKTLLNGDRMVAVHVKHMIDDHWKVSVFNIVVHEEGEEPPDFPEADAGRNPAMAVARIVGSADRVPRTGPDPPASRRSEARPATRRDGRPPESPPAAGDAATASTIQGPDASSGPKICLTRKTQRTHL